ncbi:MAG: cyclic nucleotide-binding domain-containing protein [Candidatus Peregrinibacteria bacterium]
MPQNNQRTPEGITAVEALLKVAEEKTFQAGDYIFKEGQEDKNLYLILNGEVEVSIQAADGSEKIVGYVRPGELLGEGVLSGKILKPTSARVVQKLTVMVLSLENFKKLTEENPKGTIQFLLNVLGVVNGRLNQSNIRLMALFDMSHMMQEHKDDLRAMSSNFIQQVSGLVEATDGLLLLKNPFNQTYRTIHSTRADLNENTVQSVGLAQSRCVTSEMGHLLVVNLKDLGAVVLMRSMDKKPFELDHLRLVQLIAEQAASTIDEASRKAAEKARNILHQKRYEL